jgi:hypothetical protein
MTPDDLDSKTEHELDVIFAVEVDGWHIAEAEGGWEDDGRDLPLVSTSADAVLPWLEKWSWWECCRDTEMLSGIYVTIYFRRCDDECPGYVAAKSPTFPLAATKALIRAYRAQKQQP